MVHSLNYFLHCVILSHFYLHCYQADLTLYIWHLPGLSIFKTVLSTNQNPVKLHITRVDK